MQRHAIKFLPFLPFLLCLQGAAVADAIVVVPGKNAGHIYSPGATNTDKGTSLSVFKLGTYTSYRLESEPTGLLCDTDCTHKLTRVKSDKLTLKITGTKPFPGVTIPLKGTWSTPCANTTSESAVCEMVASGVSAQVKVVVDDKVSMGTEIPLPEGGVAWFVQTTAVGNAGYHTLAATEVEAGGPFRWLMHETSRVASLGITSAADGPGNTQKLVAAGSAAASRCATKEPAGAWYLPAQAELNVLTSAMQAKYGGLGGPWSSTEKSFSYSSKSSERSWKYEAYYLGSSTAAYEYKEELKKDVWSVKTNDTATRPVLCFRRMNY